MKMVVMFFVLLSLISCGSNGSQTDMVRKSGSPLNIISVAAIAVTDTFDCAKKDFESCIFPKATSEPSAIEGLGNEDLEDYVRKNNSH